MRRTAETRARLERLEARLKPAKTPTTGCAVMVASDGTYDPQAVALVSWPLAESRRWLRRPGESADDLMSRAAAESPPGSALVEVRP